MRYHNITKDDFLNGDGIRTVLFVSGCTHKCPGCQNPVTWNENGGIEFDAAAKAELFENLSKDYVSGVTFSGGDPFAPSHREEVLSLMKEVKETFPDKTVWAYTGYTKDELEAQGFWGRVAPLLDVLVEGRFEMAKRSVSYNWAGSTNQRVLRKESGFSLNTSDPVYIALEELKETAVSEGFASAACDVAFLEKMSQGLVPMEETIGEAVERLLKTTDPKGENKAVAKAAAKVVRVANEEDKRALADSRIKEVLQGLKREESGKVSWDAVSKAKEELQEELGISDEKFSNALIGYGIFVSEEVEELEEEFEAEEEVSTR